MPYVLHPRPHSPSPSPGAFAPLGALPRRAQRKSLFHIPDDDCSPPSPPNVSPPVSPPSEPDNDVVVGHDNNDADARIPFPSSFSYSAPLSPPLSTPSTPSPPRIVRSGSSPIILSNGKPLKPSLKSSSSSSISDRWHGAAANATAVTNANRALHTRAQSMPSTPAFTPKNVHFQEGDRIATVRVFRSTGRPRSVSTQNEDTETETEPEPAGYPFPPMSRLHHPSSPLAATPLMDIDPSPARTSPIPSPNASAYANVHLEAVSLPPARPPVLRGTILVRNVSYEKRVGVRFTLDGWTTVSEVLATYASSLTGPHPLLPTAPPTLGDHLGGPRPSSPPSSTSSSPSSSVSSSPSISAPKAPVIQQWDRFSFAIRLEDYEARLADRTLLLAASYTAPGVGEWWDNNTGANFRIAFRPRAPAVAPPAAARTGGKQLPSAAPFLAASGAANGVVAPPAAPRNNTIAQAFRPPPLVRSASSPSAPTSSPSTFSSHSASHSTPSTSSSTSSLAAVSSATRALGRLALKHYAAPTPPALSVSVPPPAPLPPTTRSEGSPTKAAKAKTSPLKIFGGQFATAHVEDIAKERGAKGGKVGESGKEGEKKEKEEPHVDEGFETGSDDDEHDTAQHTPRDKSSRTPPAAPASAPRRLQLDLPAPIPVPTLAARGPFSPTRSSPVPFAAVEGRSDATYAALIREWCFAQGDGGVGVASPPAAPGVNASAGAGAGAPAPAAGWGVPGKQNVLWVGMGG